MRKLFDRAVDFFMSIAFLLCAAAVGFVGGGLILGNTEIGNVVLASSFDIKTESFIEETGVDKNDDDYRDDAEEVANIYGTKIVYGIDQLPNGCPGPSNEYTIAFVCTFDTSYIFVNDTGVHKHLYKKPAFVDYIKHEIGHKQINDICGTIFPKLAGDNFEAVTSSYAVLYLDANPDVLQESAANFPEYKISENSDKVAKSIYNGTCR